MGREAASRTVICFEVSDVATDGTCVFYITNEMQLDGFQPIDTSGRQQESMTIPKAAHAVL
jgi:hypothetical protein